MPTEQRGRCECGAVSYRVHGELRDVVNCHCGRCRRFTGHHMAASGARRRDVVVVDQTDRLRWYAPEPRVEYGFCGACGSSLFWRTHDRPDWISITAGTLDQPCGLRTTAAWWVEEAGDYHRRDATLHEFAREP
jgi:hypothetical protein